jgi:hypothetical protein
MRLTVFSCLIPALACSRPSLDALTQHNCSVPEGTASVEHRIPRVSVDSAGPLAPGGVVIRVQLGIPERRTPVAASVALYADTAMQDTRALLHGTNAGPTGVVEWHSIAPGAYGVLVRAVGFSQVRYRLAIVSGRTDTLIVNLRTDPHCLDSGAPAT